MSNTPTTIAMEPQRPGVRVLMFGSLEDLAIDILNRLQESGLRTECDQVGTLEALADSLTGKVWDVVLCLPSTNEDRAQASRLCQQMQPGLLFLAMAPWEAPLACRLAPGELEWLVTLLRRRTQITPCPE